jgi:hypothetical protein
MTLASDLPGFCRANSKKRTQWRPKQQERGTCYFVYAGRGYALPKVERFIQTAMELVSGMDSPA